MATKLTDPKITLADKAQQIIEGVISSTSEFDEWGGRIDGEPDSRYVFNDEYSLIETLNAMLIADRCDTQNIEFLLKRYPHEAVLKALSSYDLEGIAIC